MTIEPALLTADELAAYLKKKPTWVRAHAVEIGGVKVGSSWRFEWATVERYLNRHRSRDPLAPTPLSAKVQERKRRRAIGSPR